MAWQHNANTKFRKNRSEDALPSLGTHTDRGAASLYWAYRTPRKARVGSESPLRRLDGPDMDIKSGDRVYVHGHERLGFGWACGPVTLDNGSIWLVAFDATSDYEEDKTGCFQYADLRKCYDV